MSNFLNDFCTYLLFFSLSLCHIFYYNRIFLKKTQNLSGSMFFTRVIIFLTRFLNFYVNFYKARTKSQIFNPLRALGIHRVLNSPKILSPRCFGSIESSKSWVLRRSWIFLGACIPIGSWSPLRYWVFQWF